MRVRLTSRIGYKDTERPIGFSWTTLFFGNWVPLFRGDWLFLGGFILLQFLVDALHYFVWEGYRIWIPLFGGRAFPIHLGFGALLFLRPLFYNGLSLRFMLQKGYEPSGSRDFDCLLEKGLIRQDGSVRGIFGIQLPKFEFLVDTPKWISLLLVGATMYLFFFYQGPQSARHLLEDSYSRPMYVLHEEVLDHASIVWYQTAGGEDLNVTVRTQGWLGHQLHRNFDLRDSMDELVAYGFAYLWIDDFIVGVIEDPNIAYVMFHDQQTGRQVQAEIRPAGMLRFMHVYLGNNQHKNASNITATAFDATGEMLAGQ